MCAIFAIPGVITAFASESANGGLAATSFKTALEAYKSGDFATALIHGKVSGARGHSDAQVLVGHILMHGETSLIDKHGAAKWFFKAAGQGNTDAMVALGELGLSQSGGLTHTDALSWLIRAANKGRTDAMRILSDMYMQGKGTAPDPAQAHDWLIRASNFGDSLSERKMGDMYFESNPVEALKWYEKAAGKGDHEAAYIAAIMYAENFGIRPDAARATKLLAQAAKAGHAAAMADYGLMVYQGNSVARSASGAADWFRKSAEGGDPEGRFLYAFTLSKGDGVTRNFEEAYYWLLLADRDSARTGADDYDNDRMKLKKRLEANVDATTLARARARVNTAD